MNSVMNTMVFIVIHQKKSCSRVNICIVTSQVWMKKAIYGKMNGTMKDIVARESTSGTEACRIVMELFVLKMDY
jgi:hypothetical protein